MGHGASSLGGYFFLSQVENRVRGSYRENCGSAASFSRVPVWLIPSLLATTAYFISGIEFRIFRLRTKCPLVVKV